MSQLPSFVNQFMAAGDAPVPSAAKLIGSISGNARTERVAPASRTAARIRGSMQRRSSGVDPPRGC